MRTALLRLKPGKFFLKEEARVTCSRAAILSAVLLAAAVPVSHYIWGPTVGTSTSGGTSNKANGQFLPITFGLRF